MSPLGRAVASMLVVVSLAAGPVCAMGPREKAPPPGGGERKPEPAAPTMTYHEAPALAALVSSGKLPGVSRRLPAQPLVVSPEGEIGPYGGTWRQALTLGGIRSLWTELLGARELRPAADSSAVEPELLESYDVSPDNRVFTFHLRRDLKWSDGNLCDAEDYRFAFEDVFLDPELVPAKPAELVAGGRLPRFDKVDQYSVRYTFAVPYAMFLRRLAQPRSALSLARPEHYLRQFHAKYAAKDKLAELVATGGYEGWTELFRAMSQGWTNPELPLLGPWAAAKQAAEEGPEGVLRLERNPYFWQVDTSGNQLPYIDRLEITVSDDVQSCVRAAAAGEVDLQITDIASERTRTVLEERAEAGGYRLVDVRPMHANIHTIFLNRTASDAAKAKLFGDFRFRQALSLALDRQAISATLHGGRGRASQVAPPGDAPAYDAELAGLFAEHDVEGARELLDEIGLGWDGEHERRLDGEGKPLELSLVFPLSWPAEQEEAMAMARDDWSRIGISVSTTPLGRVEWMEVVRRGDYDLASYAVNVGGGPYLPLSSNGLFPVDSYWFPAPQWGAWLLDRGRSGQEPPAEVKRLSELHAEYVGAASGERLVEIEREAFGLYVRNLLAIGVLERPEGELFAVVSGRFRGLPAGPLVDDLSLYHPATFSLAE